ncbi:MAG: FecR domain-containing protein [Sedimentisphaerales bacterium]|nr:FecR domain-containing protein [Sedimentisphaerales bacterium]
MKPADNIQRFFKNAGINTNPEIDETVIERMLTAQKSQNSDSALIKPNIRRIIMTSPVTKLAAAAVIIIAIFLTFHFTGNPAMTNVAWGEVLKKTEQIPTVVFDMTAEIDQPEDRKLVLPSRNYVAGDRGARSDIFHDDKLSALKYMLPAKKVAYQIRVDQKKYWRIDMSDEEAAKGRDTNDPRTWLEMILSGDYTELGRSTINGVVVEGIECNRPDMVGKDGILRLWVDVETNLPVQIVVEMLGMEGGQMRQHKYVMENFEWNVELADSTFEPDIPDDYIMIDKNNFARLDGPRTHTFHDGSTVTLADGAKIQWLDSSGKRGFEHLAGAVDVTVAKGNGEFVVTTPYGEVKALGTRFSLELVDGKDSNTREQIKLLTVEVEEGSVQVSNAKGSSIVEASRKLVVEPDQKPYDYYQDENLPVRLRERIQSMLEALTAGDSAAWMANYNIDYMYKLIKGQVEYDPNLFGGSKADAERLQKMGSDINNPQELLERFIKMGGIKKASGEIYVRSVTLNENGDHAVARCIEYPDENHIIGHTPQWHYFDNDWWQIDD